MRQKRPREVFFGFCFPANPARHDRQTAQNNQPETCGMKRFHLKQPVTLQL
jgi:hypothetical protein